MAGPQWPPAPRKDAIAAQIAQLRDHLLVGRRREEARAVGRPDDVLDGGGADLGDGLALLVGGACAMEKGEIEPRPTADWRLAIAVPTGHRKVDCIPSRGDNF